ncbi:hypothetical protein KAU45_06725 [bacterium]|nr:hypothetical protein [bacterium]
MRRTVPIASILILTAVLSLMIAAGTGDAPVLTVVVTANTWGELATCG